MVKTYLTILTLIFLSLSSSLTSTAYAQQNYSNVIAFGDSLSDTGNLSSVSVPFPYPFYENRVSDGPVALDYLTESIGFNADASLHLNEIPSGYNYAVAGGNIIGSDAEDLAPQVSAHLDRVSGSTDPQALHVMIIGGNDIRGVRSIASSDVANAEIELIVNQFIAQLTRLSSAGAQHFFITNVPNVGRIPETLMLGETVGAQAQAYTQAYNTLLATRLESFSQQTDATIILFDLYNTLEQILDNALVLGFSYTEEGCFVDLDFHSGCFFGFGFDNFVFFDNIHPTNATNQIVAQAMINKLNEIELEPEPEPQPEPTLFLLPIGVIMLLLDD